MTRAPNVHVTQRDSATGAAAEPAAIPGLVVVWSGARPALAVHRLGAAPVIIGRDLDGVDAADERISRRHASVRIADGGIAIADLDSRNGTVVDGARITGETWIAAPAVIRAGRTLAIAVRDAARFERAAIRNAGDAVVGPTLAPAWARIERAARTGDGLLVTGESGTGKELAARAYHAAAGRAGELVAVNCAAIPEGVAERLLFGTRRGAYSGADRDAAGLLEAASGGTVFLDELGELDRDVQAKLLRALETREVLPLGAARPVRIDVRVVGATLRDLREEVGARRFRADLYHRVGRPEVRLPSLRDRREEIPWLVARAVGGVAAGDGVAVHHAVVEACLLRPWPGNTRELLGELRRAAHAAIDAGRHEVRLGDLDPLAGLMLPDRAALGPAPAPARPAALRLPDRDAITAALAAQGGNVSQAARDLGVHRNQLRRFLARER
jgi:transcriptional regulator with PAS, ATPase and Fis domain